MFIGCRAFAANSDWRSQRESSEDGVVNVAAHIAKGAGTEIEPFAPVTGMVPTLTDERTLSARTEPEVPIQPLRDWVGAVGLFAVVPPRLITPGMHLFHFSDGPFLDQFHGRPVLAAGVDLNAHLRHEFPIPSGLG